MQLEWASEKNHTTSPDTKIIQPLHPQNHSTSQNKSHLSNKKKIMQPLHKTAVTVVTVVTEVTKKLFSPGYFLFY